MSNDWTIKGDLTLLAQSTKESVAQQSSNVQVKLELKVRFTSQSLSISRLSLFTLVSSSLLSTSIAMSTIKGLLFGDPLPTHDRRGKSKGILHRSVAIAANNARGMPPGNYQQAGAKRSMTTFQPAAPMAYAQQPMQQTYDQQSYPPSVTYGQQPPYASQQDYEGIPPPQYSQPPTYSTQAQQPMYSTQTNFTR